MFSSIGSVSYGIAFFAYASLTLMLIVSRRKDERSGPLLVASGVSTVWALLATLQTTRPELFWAFGGIADSMRILAWAYFLHSVSQTRNSAVETDENNNAMSPSNDTALRKFNYTFPLLATILISAHLCLWWADIFGLLSAASVVRTIATLWIVVCICALLRLERFVRATPPKARSAIRLISIGLGTMFLFDFIIFTDAQLFSRINTDLWFARGFIYALAVPLIAMTIARNPQWSVSLHVSRQAVSSSITVLAGGAYLLITAVAAYFVRYSGVEWASVAEVVVILIALVVLAILAFSANLRSRIRIFVSKHLFNFKYDYRHEWLNFTNTLASHIGDTPNALLRGLTGLVNSDGGILWTVTDQGSIDHIGSHGHFAQTSMSKADAEAIQEFMIKTHWLIDLDELRENPQRYQGLSVGESLLADKNAWLILPLMFHDELLACLTFERSALQKDINWEDRDLLKTAGRQAATLLKQEQTQLKLAEANQFQAFSKLSAYIVHDLKNIIGQQSLLVSNATKHKHKPEFVDDVIITVDNSVKRMQALLEQLRSSRSEEKAASVNIVETLEKVILNRCNRAPVPTLKTSINCLMVNAEPERLQRVFGHLVQNAQEATPAQGSVSVDVRSSDGQIVVSVRDTGSGMKPEFIINGLFTAFESTKGLTGMGIGVFESREYLRSIGADISVVSQIGTGTVFTVTLPLLKNTELQNSVV